MNRILELQLTYRLSELLNATKRKNSADILLENEEYYLAMLIDIRNYQFDQVKFAFVKKQSDLTKYVMYVSNLTVGLDPQNAMKHLKEKYSDALTYMKFEVVDKITSRKEFENHYSLFFKDKKQLHSKEKLELEKTTKKPIMSYEKNIDFVTKHLVVPRTDKEKKMAILERETFNNPKMWRYKL